MHASNEDGIRDANTLLFSSFFFVSVSSLEREHNLRGPQTGSSCQKLQVRLNLALWETAIDEYFVVCRTTLITMI